MSSSGNLALQNPPTLPTSLISDDDDDEVFTPKHRNPTQHLPNTPNRHPHLPQLCQQLTSIPGTPESPNLENRNNLTYFDPTTYRKKYNICLPSYKRLYSN